MTGVPFPQRIKDLLGYIKAENDSNSYADIDKTQ